MVIRYPAERNSLPYLLSPRAERRLSVRKNADPGSNFIRRTAHAQLSQPLTALDPAAAARVARWATSRLISEVFFTTTRWLTLSCSIPRFRVGQRKA